MLPLPSWKAVFRRASRALFKCRLSLSPAGAVSSRLRSANKRSPSIALPSPTRNIGDSAYMLAAVFVVVLLLILTVQVVVVRRQVGKSHRSSSSFVQQQQQQRQSRPALRFGRPALASRVLANIRPVATGGGGGKANDVIVTNDDDSTEWMEAIGRDKWVERYHLCLSRRTQCPWQPVRGPSKVFVYSAYVDGEAVRVIGVAKTKRPDRLWCHLSLRANETTVRWTQVAAQVKVIREHWNLKLSAVFILCPFKGVDSVAPEFVSISSVPNAPLFERVPELGHTVTGRTEFNVTHGHWFNSSTGNLLSVTRHRQDEEAVHELTVCVKPLHYDFDRTGQLVEFIEMHRLLGVSHFTFYNHTVGRRVDCLLRRYQAEGLVSVLPWQHLNVTSQKEIRTEGIFASLNDCLYRHMVDSRYLLMIDLDELVVPRIAGSTLPGLLATVNNASTGNGDRIGAYYFRNAFFYMSWPDDVSLNNQWKASVGESMQLTSLRKTRRNVKLHPHRIRSKYICRPKRVVEVGNHFVWEFRTGKVAAHIPDSLAVMHHYRTCEFGGDTCLANPSVVDRSAWQYGDALTSAVRARLHQFRPTCPAL